jgi:hypothetical protein
MRQQCAAHAERQLGIGADHRRGSSARHPHRSGEVRKTLTTAGPGRSRAIPHAETLLPPACYSLASTARALATHVLRDALEPAKPSPKAWKPCAKWW